MKSSRPERNVEMIKVQIMKGPGQSSSSPSLLNFYLVLHVLLGCVNLPANYHSLRRCWHPIKLRLLPVQDLIVRYQPHIPRKTHPNLPGKCKARTFLLGTGDACAKIIPVKALLNVSPWTLAVCYFKQNNMKKFIYRLACEYTIMLKLSSLTQEHGIETREKYSQITLY